MTATHQNSTPNVITDHLDSWASTIKKKKGVGRGSSKKIELYGIKKLRELILELAVRGLLVPQNPNDETASELLKRVAAKKEKLIKDGKIKKQKRLAPISNDEKRFDLPAGWAWARLTEVYDVRDGTHDTPKYHDKGYPLVTSKNLSSGKLDFSNIKYISEADHNKISERSKVDKGDILFAMIGSIGNPVLVDTEAEFSIKNVALFKYYLREMSVPAFLLRFLLFAEAIFKDQSSGAVQAFVSLGKLRGFPISLPPLEEQHRIVAKVDELMALCDQLEQQQEDSISAHQTLVKTLLDALVDAASHSQATAGQTKFEQAWQRIAEHFDTLFTTEDSVDQLKQTILQLAVMGKLVPQNPSDEPASKLLKRLVEKKNELNTDKGTKKQKQLSAVTHEERPFDIPCDWALERVGNLTEKLGSGSTPRGGKNAYVSSGVPFLRSQNIWNEGLKLDDVAYIPMDTHNKMVATKVLPGDVLLNITGASLGRSTIFPEELIEANVSQHVTIIRLLLPELAQFIHLGILSPMIQKLVWDRQVGMAIEGLSKKVFERFEFPIPPLEEQKRIVSKVDELMALCDQLKVGLNNAQATQLHLSDIVADQTLNQ